MNIEMQFKNITRDGQTWRYYDAGEGQPIVLFHGFPDSPHAFAGVAAALQARGYRTIVPYLRGYHPDTVVADRPYDAAHIAADGIGLLDALELDKVVLVGHDWGASVGYGIAAAAPERLHALVTIAIPHPASLQPSLKALWALRHFFYFKAPFAESRTRRNNFAYLEKMGRRLLPTATSAEFSTYLHNVRTLFSDPIVLKGMLDYYRQFSFTLGPEFRKTWHIPSLLIAGSEEVDILGGVATYERGSAMFEPPGQLYIMPGAVHSPHHTNLDLFMTQLNQFLDRLQIAANRE